MRITREEIASIAGSLDFICWGVGIWVIDVTVNLGTNYNFDIINDFLGIVLIGCGVFRLGRIDVGERYRNMLAFVKAVVFLAGLQALSDNLGLRTPKAVSAVLSLLELLKALGIILFCRAMVWLCSELGFSRAAGSWRVTLLLYVFTCLVPAWLLGVIGLLRGGGRITLDIGIIPTVLVLSAFTFVPLIHFFVSAWRTKSELKARINPAPNEG